MDFGKLGALLCLVILFTMTRSTASQRQWYCPHSATSKTVPLGWTKDLATLAFVCSGEFVSLYCCAEGYTHIQWLIRRPGQDWKPVFINYAKYLEQKNQTLTITASDEQRDEALYRCIVTDQTGKKIQNDVKLNVQECSSWKRPPVVFLPQKNKTIVHVSEGKSMSVDCAAFFGDCKKSITGCYIDWMKMNHSDSILIEPGNLTDRVYVKVYYERFQSLGQDSVLYINTVKPSDYGHYVCWAYSAFGRVKREVSIAPPEPDHRVAIVAGTVVLCFAMVLVAGFLLYHKCGLDLKLLYKDKFKRKSHQDKEFDALVLHSDADDAFVEELKGVLSAHHYNISSVLDVNPGQRVMDEFTKVENESACFICIVSPDFFADDNCVTFSHNVIRQEFRTLIYIIFKEIGQPEKERLERENPFHFKSIQVSKKLKWPPLDEKGQQNKKKVQKFWKELRLRLPPQRPPPNIEESSPNKSSAKKSLPSGASDSSGASYRPLLMSVASGDGDEVFDDAVLKSQVSRESGFASGNSLSMSL